MEIWRKEHGRAILAAVNKVCSDVDTNELEVPESMEGESVTLVDEWEDIRDDSELCQLLLDTGSDFQDIDMLDIDQSGTEQRSISSFVESLFR